MINKVWMRGKGEGQTRMKMKYFVKGIMQQMKYTPVATDFTMHHQDSKSYSSYLDCLTDTRPTLDECKALFPNG